MGFNRVKCNVLHLDSTNPCYEYSMRNTSLEAITEEKDLPYILVYKSHFLYSEIECVLYAGQTKREGHIWHNLGGHTIILFFNLNNEYMNIRTMERKKAVFSLSLRD